MKDNTNPRKICFINPPTTEPHESQVYFPMALLTLGGVAKKHHLAAELWDFDLYFKKVKNSTVRDLKKLIHMGVKGVRTNVFAISAICSNFPMALWLAKEIKACRPDSVIILGGPQPSSVPKEIIENFPFIDVVVIGEGEITFEEILLKEFRLEKITTVPGTIVRYQGQIHLNEPRPLAPDMDTFPLPDYSLINFPDYVAHTTGVFLPHIEVGRGCPFRCTFCSTSLMWQKNYRVKSPQRIFREMESLYQEYGFKQVELIHDNFTTSRKFVLDFCEYMEQNNHHGLKWSVSSRTDCLDLARLERMRGAGLWGIFFGMESGSNRMQQVIKKKLDFEHFEPILRKGNQLGLSLTTAFILGFPEETAEDIDQTINKALYYKSIGTATVYFSKLTALTGTSIYEQYLPKLEVSLQASTVSPQLYGMPEIDELIRSFPKLFSSYYHVPHPKFSKEYLTRLVEFAHLLVNGFPKKTLRLIKCERITPVQLFVKWDQWTEEKRIVYYNYLGYGVEDFQGDFEIFLSEVFPGFRSNISSWLAPAHPVGFSFYPMASGKITPSTNSVSPGH